LLGIVRRLQLRWQTRLLWWALWRVICIANRRWPIAERLTTTAWIPTKFFSTTSSYLSWVAHRVEVCYIRFPRCRIYYFCMSACLSRTISQKRDAQKLLAIFRACCFRPRLSSTLAVLQYVMYFRFSVAITIVLCRPISIGPFSICSGRRICALPLCQRHCRQFIADAVQPLSARIGLQGGPKISPINFLPVCDGNLYFTIKWQQEIIQCNKIQYKK